MKTFLLHWWHNKKILIIFGCLLAAVGTTALIPGTFLRILPVWLHQLITSLSTVLISIGGTIVLIDCFVNYQQYQRALVVLSKFRRHFERLSFEIYRSMNDILFEGHDFFDAELSTNQKLAVFSEQLKEVEGCPDPNNLVVFYREFLLNLDTLVNLLPYMLNLTDFDNLNETLDDLFMKAMHLQRLIKTSIQQHDIKETNNGFAPQDFSDFLCDVVGLNKYLSQISAK
jgi:hypothetical protein